MMLSPWETLTTCAYTFLRLFLWIFCGLARRLGVFFGKESHSDKNITTILLRVVFCMMVCLNWRNIKRYQWIQEESSHATHLIKSNISRSRGQWRLYQTSSDSHAWHTWSLFRPQGVRKGPAYEVFPCKEMMTTSTGWNTWIQGGWLSQADVTICYPVIKYNGEENGSTMGWFEVGVGEMTFYLSLLCFPPFSSEKT